MSVFISPGRVDTVPSCLSQLHCLAVPDIFRCHCHHRLDVITDRGSEETLDDSKVRDVHRIMLLEYDTICYVRVLSPKSIS